MAEDTEEPKRPIQAKAKGKKLTTKSKRILQNIPPEFIAEAGLRQTKQAVPTETEIDTPMAVDQVGSSVEMDNTTQSQKTDEFLDTPMPVTLVDSVITPQNQLGTRTRVLNTGIQTLTPSATQVEGTVENKGANKSIKTTIVVPTVFPAASFAKQVSDNIPAAFKAQIPITETRLDSAGTAVMPTLGADEILRSQEQLKDLVMRTTVQTRATPTFTPITVHSFDADLQAIIRVILSVESISDVYAPPTGVIDFDEREINGTYKLRTVYRLMADTLPASYDTIEPAVRRFPATLTGLTVAKIFLADDAAGKDRSEVRVFPTWRPGFSIEVEYIVTTTFHFTPPPPDGIYAIRTNDLVYNGISFQVNYQGVLNDAVTASITHSDDGYYGNLSESVTFAASLPTATAYNAAIGSTQVIASKIQPWRRLWVKRTTKMILK